MAFPPIILSTTRKRSALEIARQAMGELGMPRPISLTAGLDETANQLIFLLNGLGERLSRLPLWAETRAEWSITTTTADAYDLPLDWLVPLTGTVWDRTNRWPLLGPKVPTEWQYLKSGFGVAAPQYRYRFFNGQFNIFPAPKAGLNIVQEYLSAAWLRGVNPSLITQADVPKFRITADSDIPIFDDLMLITGLKLAFREAKGLDASKVQEEFEDMLEAAWGNSVSAPVLSLTPTSSTMFLSEWNAPDTGYGV